MPKNNKEIIKILQKNNFNQDHIEEIIIKNKTHAIISINTNNIDSKQTEIAKNAQESEKKIATELGFQKVTIVLTINKDDKKISQKKVPKTQSFVAKIKNILSKKSENPQKPKKAPLKEAPAKVAPRKLNNVKKIIAIASAKGGVGKSTLSANIALTLSRLGYKVALVDADIYGPSVAHIMNHDEKPQNKDGLIIPHQKYGIKFISVANLIDKEAAGIWRAAMINKILNQLILQTNWAHDGSDVDVMIVDMPPGTGDIYLSLAQNFDLSGAVLVSTPQSLSQIDLVRSIDCFEKLNVKILGLIENMSYFLQKDGKKSYIFGKSKLKDLAKQKNIDFLGAIPIIEELNNHENGPLSYDKPSHEFSHQIGIICEEIL